MDNQKFVNTLKNFKIQKMRNDEKIRRILDVYPLKTQFQLMMNRQKNPEEYKKFQDYCAKVRADVEREIKEKED